MMKHSLVYLLSMLISVAVFAQQPTKSNEKKTSEKETKTTLSTPAKPVAVETKAPANGALNIDTKGSGVLSTPTQGSNISVPVPSGFNEEALAPTTVEWTETEVEFGEIKQGEVASHVFYVKNTGTTPLKITRVKPSCGCTTPDWTKEEIMPGKAGKVEVAFDSTGKMGTQRKTVTVFYNTEQQAQILRFNGEIVQ